MSAHRFTDCRIDCDYLGCNRSVFASQFTVMDPTAAEVRKLLKAQGWKTGIDSGEVRAPRKDYCPEHARTLAG